MNSLSAFVKIVLLVVPGWVAGATLDYAALPGKKAMAVAPDDATVTGIAHSQAQDLAASQMALAQCEQANTRTTGRACELVRLNDEQIRTGRDILDAVPTTPHPLYLWRYQSDSATVYLAGSIHMLKSSLYPLAEQLQAAFDSSTHLVLEVDSTALTTQDMQMKVMKAGLLPSGQTLRGVLAQPLHERLEARLQSYGIDIAAVQRMNPAMVMNQLVLLRLMALGYDAALGMEQHFTALLGDRQILELESVDQQLEMLFGQPIETQIQLLRDALDQELDVEPIMADMITAWLSGADQRFLDLFSEQAGDSELAKAFNKQLLDDRNQGMAQKVQSYLEATGTYFVLIGAAHFIGDNGIVAILGRQQIEGTRVMSDWTTQTITDNEDTAWK
ncbi:MAG: TraB/GumN family protein [Pseudomonadales bacterium]